MLTQSESELLCPTDNDAPPIDQLMHHHRAPAVLSEQLKLDGEPIRADLFGEDLVTFGDSEGGIRRLNRRSL
jgi:phthalate 4,5-dioxygenase oxygenase subunit